MPLILVPLREADLQLACQLVIEAKEWNVKTTPFVPPMAVIGNPGSLFMSALRGEEFIGLIGYQDISWPDGTAELFFGIAPEHRFGHTFLELGKATLDYGFNTLGFRRLTSMALTDGPTISLMEKWASIGVRKEAIFKRIRLKNGAYHDAFAYALERGNYVSSPQ